MRGWGRKVAVTMAIVGLIVLLVEAFLVYRWWKAGLLGG